MPKIRNSRQKMDKILGQRLSACRKMRGISQSMLARALGVSHQQIHKYETGQSRIAASFLPDVARNLNTSISYFFEGLENGDADGWRTSKRILHINRLLWTMPASTQNIISRFVKSLASTAGKN